MCWEKFNRNTIDTFKVASSRENDPHNQRLVSFRHYCAMRFDAMRDPTLTMTSGVCLTLSPEHRRWLSRGEKNCVRYGQSQETETTSARRRRMCVWPHAIRLCAQSLRSVWRQSSALSFPHDQHLNSVWHFRYVTYYCDATVWVIIDSSAFGIPSAITGSDFALNFELACAMLSVVNKYSHRAIPIVYAPWIGHKT